MDIILIVLICINLVVTLGLVLFKSKTIDSNSAFYRVIEKENEKLRKQIAEFREIEMQHKEQLNNALIVSVRSSNENILNSLKNSNMQELEILKQLDERVHNVLTTVDSQVSRLTRTVDEKLTTMLSNNQVSLKEMRETVDEKLNTNLTKRLNESFTIISKRLEELYKSFGEIQTLSSGVSDLKKVLGNVKTRGIWGEVQLNSLLSQMLAPNQFLTNVQIKPNSDERVEFVILLPGKNNDNIYLPIDAKFPLEDYIKFCESSDAGDKAVMQTHQKAIENNIKLQAKKICEKYIYPPHTTDFAIMYIPTEGLFAEIMRNAGLVEEIQTKYKIIICSPTTISALMSSLQMGFKTLYIEKRSSEIWELLASFKHEFVNFNDLIVKTQKKISEASSTLEDASKKTNKITKQLSKVTSEAENMYQIEESNEQ